MTGYRLAITCVKGLLPFLLYMAALPVAAQDIEERVTDETEAVETLSPEPNQPIIPEPDDQDLEDQAAYIGAVHGNWEVRCIRTEEDPDPCQLYQLLEDESGTPVAEFNVFSAPDDPELVATATVVTPLETLLTVPVEISIDGGEVKSYPFLWCTLLGCISRIELTAADLFVYKAGLKAKLSIVPARAADQIVDLTVWLNGFSAGFTDLLSRSEQ